MLDEDCDIGKLEGSVKECGVQGFAEWEVCGFHGVYRIADLSGSGDDVRDVDDQQAGDNADRQYRCYFPYQIGSEDRNDENKGSDQKRTEQVWQTGQGTQCCAAGCEGNGRSDTHNAEVQELK